MHLSSKVNLSYHLVGFAPYYPFLATPFGEPHDGEASIHTETVYSQYQDELSKLSPLTSLLHYNSNFSLYGLFYWLDFPLAVHSSSQHVRPL